MTVNVKDVKASAMLLFFINSAGGLFQISWSISQLVNYQSISRTDLIVNHSIPIPSIHPSIHPPLPPRYLH